MAGFNFPDAPAVGDTYPEPPVPGFPVYKWDGEKWISGTPVVEGGKVTISTTPPTGASSGDLWYEDDTGILFIYIDDGNSKQWVMVSGGSGAPVAGAVRYDVVQALTAASKAQARTNIDAVSQVNSGRLTYVSATALAFKPFNGNQIKINGNLYTIPTGGIAGLGNTGVFVGGVAGQALAANNSYLVNAFDNAGVVTANFTLAANGHVTSVTGANAGTEVLVGSELHTIIGLVFVNATSQFEDWFVLSWFNRRNKSYRWAGTVGNAANQAALGFITWGEEAVHLSFSGYIGCNAASHNYGQHSVDAVATGNLVMDSVQTSGYYSSHSSTITVSLADGYHTHGINVNVSTNSAVVANFNNSMMVRG